jgi:hypothetical protein
MKAGQVLVIIAAISMLLPGGCFLVGSIAALSDPNAIGLARGARDRGGFFRARRLSVPPGDSLEPSAHAEATGSAERVTHIRMEAGS